MKCQYQNFIFDKFWQNKQFFKFIFVEFLGGFMFYTNFINHCNQKKMKPAQVVKALGISGGSATGWKKGTIPSQKTINLLAEFFNVPPEYFFIDHSKNTDLSEDEKRLIAAYRKQTEEGKKMVRKLLDLEEPANRVIDDVSDPNKELVTDVTNAFTKTSI